MDAVQKILYPALRVRTVFVPPIFFLAHSKIIPTMKVDLNFQTPEHVCKHMCSMLTLGPYMHVLEPTAGIGNLARHIPAESVICPEDFFEMVPERFDAVVMNPPFTPMAKGYEILFQCMQMTDEVVALLPWLTIINSKKRTDALMEYGLKSVTHLPRSVFNGARVQCCILHLVRGYDSTTSFFAYSQNNSDI